MKAGHQFYTGGIIVSPHYEEDQVVAEAYVYSKFS